MDDIKRRKILECIQNDFSEDIIFPKTKNVLNIGFSGFDSYKREIESYVNEMIDELSNTKDFSHPDFIILNNFFNLFFSQKKVNSNKTYRNNELFLRYNLNKISKNSNNNIAINKILHNWNFDKHLKDAINTYSINGDIFHKSLLNKKVAVLKFFADYVSEEEAIKMNLGGAFLKSTFHSIKEFDNSKNELLSALDKETIIFYYSVVAKSIILSKGLDETGIYFADFKQIEKHKNANGFYRGSDNNIYLNSNRVNDTNLSIFSNLKTIFHEIEHAVHNNKLFKTEINEYDDYQLYKDLFVLNVRNNDDEPFYRKMYSSNKKIVVNEAKARIMGYAGLKHLLLDLNKDRYAPYIKAIDDVNELELSKIKNQKRVNYGEKKVTTLDQLFDNLVIGIRENLIENIGFPDFEYYFDGEKMCRKNAQQMLDEMSLMDEKSNRYEMYENILKFQTFNKENLVKNHEMVLNYRTNKSKIGKLKRELIDVHYPNKYSTLNKMNVSTFVYKLEYLKNALLEKKSFSNGKSANILVEEKEEDRKII